jgi:hypothetical protein
MKRFLLALVLLVVGSVNAFGQATGASKFVWDQTAPSLSEANSYTYKYYADGSATAVAFAGVTCTGSASPYTCEVAIPAFTPGTHTIQLTASNVAGESTKSAVFTFTFVVVPGAPANIRIQ